MKQAPARYNPLITRLSTFSAVALIGILKLVRQAANHLRTFSPNVKGFVQARSWYQDFTLPWVAK